MSTQLNTQNLKIIILRIAGLFKRYSVFIFTNVSILILTLLVFKIDTLANREPSSELVDEKSNKNQNFTIDSSIVKQLEQLKDANVDVKAIFEQTRDNPFQE